MKIAILTSGILPVPAVLGGAVENLIDYYIEYNNQEKLHDITVYSIALPPSSSIADTANTHYHYIDTTSFWRRLKRHIYVRTHSSTYYDPYIEYFLHESLKDIARKEYDIIILENRPGYAIPVSKVSKAKIIIHLHNDLLNKDSKNAKEICQVCHKVITVSDYIKGRVETIGSNISITTVHNGIDLERFYHATPIDRKTMGFKEDDFIVVYSGRLIKEKGIEEYLYCAKKYAKRAEFDIIGYCEEAYENQVEELQRDGVLRFHGFQSDVKSFYKDADAIVIASYHEGMSNVLLEAAATGRPVLATNIPGCKEAVEDNMTGLLFTPRSAEALESTIEFFISMPVKQRKAMGQAARVKMEQEFDRRKVVESYMEEINRVI